MRSRGEARAERATARDQALRDFQIEVPGDVVNEQVILACMAVDADVRRRFARAFRPETFTADQHRIIFVAHQEMERRGLAYDPAALSRVAPDADIRVLEQLDASRSELPPNLEFHVDALLWDEKRAQAVRGPLAAAIDAVQNPNEDRGKVRALARQFAAAFDDVESRTPHLRDTRQVVRDMMTNLRRRVAGDAFFPFGVPGLDTDEDGVRRLRPGADPGGVTIVTGKSGAGKTSLAAHLIIGLARQKRRVCVGAWEVRAPMTMELITTIVLGWSRTRVLDGKTNRVRDDAPMTEEELDLFQRTADKIAPWIVFVDNPFQRGSIRTKGRVTNDDYLDVLEDHLEASGCEVALLDLFDRCLRHRRPDDEQEALWRMHEMADAQQKHLVIVHQQLLKGDDVRKDGKPSLAGLKGSSAYVDVGQTILAPHMPALFKDVPNDKFEVYGLKQRFSPPFAVEFDWDPDRAQISNGRTVPIHAELFDAADEAHGRPAGVAKPRRGRS